MGKDEIPPVDAASAPPSNNTAGTGCLILFGVPFFLAGLFVIYQAFTGRVQGDFSRLGQVAFGALFAIVGGGIMVGGVAASRYTKRKEALAAAHPTEPWLANPAWADGRIQGGSGWGIVGLWLFTLVWTGMGTAGTISVLGRGERGMALFVLLFPAIGALMVVISIYQTIKHFKFGRSSLELETLPGCVGGWFAGTIQTRTSIDSEAIQVKLQCVHKYTTGSGKNRSTHENILWQEEQVLAGRLAQGGLGGSAIPLAFRIPPGCRVTDDSNPSDQILWRLNAHATLPGADYSTSFIVPVFDAPHTQAAGYVPAIEPAALAIRRPSPAQSGQGDDPSIRLMRGPGDKKRFVIPAGRNPGFAVFATVTAIVFACVGGVVQFAGGPVWVVYVLEGIAALIAWGALKLWFRSIEISADKHAVEKTWRMLFRSGTRTIPRADLDSITYHSDTRVNDTPYYRIDAKLTQGGKVKLASGFRQRDAEWIAGELGEAAGVSVSGK